jgi:hypothetical protein
VIRLLTAGRCMKLKSARHLLGLGAALAGMVAVSTQGDFVIIQVSKASFSGGSSGNERKTLYNSAPANETFNLNLSEPSIVNIQYMTWTARNAKSNGKAACSTLDWDLTQNIKAQLLADCISANEDFFQNRTSKDSTKMVHGILRTFGPTLSVNNDDASTFQVGNLLLNIQPLPHQWSQDLANGVAVDTTALFPVTGLLARSLTMASVSESTTTIAGVVALGFMFVFGWNILSRKQDVVRIN